GLRPSRVLAAQGAAGRRSWREARGDELPERLGAVAHPVFRRRRHLAEGHDVAIGLEYGIVAEAVLSARRPDDGAVGLALEALAMAVGRAQRQGADEMTASLLRLARAGIGQLAIEPFHGKAEIAGDAGPACGVDPRLAIQRV